MRVDSEKNKEKTITFTTRLKADHGEVISIELKDLVMNSESTPASSTLLHHLRHIDPVVFVPAYWAL